MSELVDRELETLRRERDAAHKAWNKASWERDEYLSKLKHCLTAGETTARLLDQAERERDELRKRQDLSPRQLANLGRENTRLVQQLEAVRTERDEALDLAQKEGERGDRLNTALINLNLDLNEARAEVVRLRDDLGKYGDHETYCRVKSGGDRCTCGYHAALEPHDGS